MADPLLVVPRLPPHAYPAQARSAFLLPPSSLWQVDHIRFLANPVPLEPGSKITFQETPNTGGCAVAAR